jgi:hypothetical protein
MAYLRKEEDVIELVYPLNKVWMAIPKALDSLGWTVEQIDDTTHHVKAKTQASRMSWSTALQINAVLVSGSTTKVSVVAESVATIITAIIDFGKVRRCINLFFEELLKQLT